MSGPSRSPYWALIAPAAAVAGALARWLIQGSGNVYTTASKRFYLPDPDLGWRIVPDGPPWIGLEVVAVLAGFTLALAGMAWFIRKRELVSGSRWAGARAGLWILAILPLAVPIWAFSGGLAPRGAVEQLPPGVIGPPPGTIEGTLASVPAGKYTVLPGEGSSVTAKISAGGEDFSARFTGNIGGSLSFDPADLRKPVEAWVRVDTASVDTGVTMRSKHAREEYLYADKFPEIRLTLSELVGARQGASAAELVFWANGVIELMGARIPVPVSGTIRALDEAGRARVGAQGPALVVSAELTLDLAATPLAKDAKDFDSKSIPVQASLVLTQAP